MSKLYFRYGAMGCGKTAQLLQVAFNYNEKGIKAIVMKPKLDTKAGEKLFTRIGLYRDIDHLIESSEDLYELISKKYKDVGCVLIDEAQFLERSQVDQLMKVVIEFDIPVLCYGIRTNFLTEGFSGSTRLLEIAHSIEELKTICSCGKKAMFNARYVDGVLVNSGESVLIDDSANIKYVAMCPSCYYKEIDKINI